MQEYSKYHCPKFCGLGFYTTWAINNHLKNCKGRENWKRFDPDFDLDHERKKIYR